jgi:CRP/FNR family transcriptional regulator
MSNDLNRAALFRALTDSDRKSLMAETRVLDGVRGKLLVRKGAAIPGAFLVLDGVLRIYAMNSDGKEATLYRLHGGELCPLSLNAAFSGTRFPAWVSVESKSASVAVLPGLRTREIFAHAPVMQELVLASLTGAIDELLTQFDEAMLLPLGERILNLLIRSTDSSRSVAITHQQLADHLGVTREAASRELANLARRKILQTGRNRITLLEQRKRP